MKKVILSLGLLAAVTTVANAQATFGVKAGVNLSNVSGDDTDEFKSVVGANVGVAANFGFSDMFSFQPELLFSMKGAKVEEGNDKIEIRTNYIDVPLLVKANADGLFFEAGPQIGFLLSQKTTYDIAGMSGSSSETDGTRKVDIGYIAGVGYQLESGLSLGVRYNGGITDLSDPSGDSKQRNSVFQLQLGYMFGGK